MTGAALEQQVSIGVDANRRIVRGHQNALLDDHLAAPLLPTGHIPRTHPPVAK
jgi:hypothetical protein